MRIIDDWKKVMRRAWSVRLLLLAAAASGAEVAMPYMEGVLPVTPGAFAGLSFAITVGAFVARFVAQPSIHDGEDQ